MASSSNRFYYKFFYISIIAFSPKGLTMPVAPVMTVKPLVSVMQGEHIVLKGETLYSIAWRYDRDFRELATINNIASPYYLKVGQRLSLQLNEPVPSSEILSKAPVSHTWHWPTTGKIIKSFSSELNKALNKGIDIAGQLGSPIQAAMPGKVVYSGNGLRGLGQLLIIKHDEHFLSAYAHNQELMVKEGQYVKQGQVVAKMGGQSDTAKLHFEIRYKGHAVNPLNYLPQ